MPFSIQLSDFSPDDTILKLPPPHLCEYVLQQDSKRADSSASLLPYYKLLPKAGKSWTNALPDDLKRPSSLTFTEPADLKNSELPSPSNNSHWARARRAPSCGFVWGDETPTLAQAWLHVYLLFTLQPDREYIRLEIEGKNAALLGQQMKDVLLAIDHPQKPQGLGDASDASGNGQLLLLRSTFWQGAGSPFGPRPAWLPSESPASLSPRLLSSYPLTPLQYTMTIAPTGDPANTARYQQSWHPVRPVKPAPGSTIYARWIPHLRETFSMVALDYHDQEHLRLFHEWQNDPRVSQGWNETGTLDQHREYLRRILDDPHQIAVLAKFDDTCFAYFEVYWAKEDRLGAYYDAGDWDRGRHSLVGDIRYRGPHRVSAWWSSLMHYLFLDDPRTMYVVGEPKETNNTVVAYDFMHGFGLDKFVDLPHKRSAFVRCSRERFFQLCPLGDNEKVIGGMRIGLVPKL